MELQDKQKIAEAVRTVRRLFQEENSLRKESKAIDERARLIAEKRKQIHDDIAQMVGPEMKERKLRLARISYMEISITAEMSNNGQVYITDTEEL